MGRRRKISAFDIIYMTMRDIYSDRVQSYGVLPDHHIDFAITEKFKKDKHFNEKFASVLNYVTAQILMKMNCSSFEIQQMMTEIVDEQIHLIDPTMVQFPDGPIRQNK